MKVLPEVERLPQENSALRIEDGRDRNRPKGEGVLPGLFFVGDRAATLHLEQGRLGVLFKSNQNIRCDDSCVRKDGVGHQGGICA